MGYERDYGQEIAQEKEDSGKSFPFPFPVSTSCEKEGQELSSDPGPALFRIPTDNRRHEREDHDG